MIHVKIAISTGDEDGANVPGSAACYAAALLASAPGPAAGTSPSSASRRQRQRRERPQRIRQSRDETVGAFKGHKGADLH
eukprot:2986658-Pleurochrysis_carterae.AAC.2